MLRSEAGMMAFVEYFVVAIVALLAAVAFFDAGRFQGARTRVENAFQTLMRAACHNCEFN